MINISIKQTNGKNTYYMSKQHFKFIYTIPSPATFMLKWKRNNLMSHTTRTKFSTPCDTWLHQMFMYLTLFPEHLITLLYILLLLLLNSSCKIDLEFSINMFLLFSCVAFTVLLLCSTHPAGGFLPFSGDGVFSKVALVVEFSISNNSSPQSEDLHQHLVSPHLSHVSQ